MKVDWEKLQVGDSTMRVLACVPDEGRAPAVIVCMHAPGLDNFMEEIGRRLAKAGYAAYAPDFYHRQGDTGEGPLERLARLRDTELEIDLAAVHGHALAQGHQRIAVIGFCMGGRIALIGASVLADLDATVSFYGGFVRDAWGEGDTPLVRATRIECPTLLIGGALDSNPSPDDIAELSQVLQDRGHTPEVEIYDDVGHAFLNFNRPDYKAQPAARAWQQCERFLARHMRGPRLTV